MKVTVKDRDILRTVRPETLTAHLQANGWHEDRRLSDKASIWLWCNGSNEEFEILLPLRQTLGDYVARIVDALETLETVEKRSQLEILNDLITSANNIKIQGIVIDADMETHQATLLGFAIGIPQKIKLQLAPPALDLALKAFQDRCLVTCYGDLTKTLEGWELQHPRNFTLDLDGETAPNGLS